MTDNNNPSLMDELQPAGGDIPQEFLVSEQEMQGATEVEGEALPGAPADLPDAAEASAAVEALDAPEPGESSNPEIALEQMLSAASTEELPLEVPSAGMLLKDEPSFQLLLSSLSPEAVGALKKACADQGVEVSEKAWELGAPALSQLTEFQAIALSQAARRQGAVARIRTAWPGEAPSEEDLALGDLSGVPDTALIVTEGSPAVALPGSEKEVLLCTPDQLPGFSVQETKGVVSSHCSLARRLFREEELKEKLEKELRSVPGRVAAPLPASQLQLVLRQLFFELQKRALGLSANAVLGVKIEAFPETTHLDPQLEQMRLVAFGTAAVVEKP